MGVSGGDIIEWKVNGITLDDTDMIPYLYGRKCVLIHGRECRVSTVQSWPTTEQRCQCGWLHEKLKVKIQPRSGGEEEGESGGQRKYSGVFS